MSNYKENRPWGEFENILESKNCKVKKITVKAGQSPSYQYHFKRSEIWVVVKGSGKLKLDGNITRVKYGHVINVEKEQAHQITNDGAEDLVFIEVQLGEYFGEDDIVRLEDNYGRS
tara:strand:- start:140 stop:487 length:348 start_codon:yes stop_codon:yes gene_type:complete